MKLRVSALPLASSLVAAFGLGVGISSADDCSYGCGAWRCFVDSRTMVAVYWEVEDLCAAVFRMPTNEVVVGLMCVDTDANRRRIDSDGTTICVGDFAIMGKATGGCEGDGEWEPYTCCDRCDEDP